MSRKTPLPCPSHDAINQQARARQLRVRAAYLRDEGGDRIGAILDDAKADELDAAAEVALDPLSHSTRIARQERGGEMVIATREVLDEVPGIVDTVRMRGDMLAADASLQRLDLAGDAGVLTLGVDAAESIQAQNSLERMLAHQMAAAHRMAMDMIGDAREEMRDYQNSGHAYPHRSIEAARMANTAARLMETYQRALLTLDRLRNGGRQVMTVQHVSVGNGGQAVVAGTVQPTRRKEAKS